MGDDDATTREAAHAELASTLWHEREQLEELLYALTCQQLVLTTGGERWLTRADGQTRDAVAAVADGELRRAMATEELLARLGLPGETSLDALVAAADEPWNTLLADHRDALRTLIAELSLATAENRRLLQAGSELARETLARVGDTVHDGRA